MTKLLNYIITMVGCIITIILGSVFEALKGILDIADTTNKW